MKQNLISIIVFFAVFCVYATDYWVDPAYNATYNSNCWYFETSGTGKFTTVKCSANQNTTFYPSTGNAFTSGNGYADYLTGLLKCVCGCSGNTGARCYTVLICPDTAYCQKSQCGANCTVHGGSGNCTMVTCSTCNSTYCSWHCVHGCFSIACPEGVTHIFSYTVNANDASGLASAQAQMEAARPVIGTCSVCKGSKCSICAHTCKHGIECVLKACTVCGVQWCNIHGVVPIYTTCTPCGRMTCNHQAHTCNPTDPTNPNQNPNQTSSQTANNTSQTANNTSQTANNTSQISNNTSQISNNTSQISNNTTTIANNTTQISNNTTTIANNTTQISNNTTTIANNTTQIANNTTQIANNTTQIANNTTQIANNTTEISNNTSQTANNTSQIASNTSQMASSLNVVATGVTNAAGAAQNAADAAKEAADKIPDKVEPVEMRENMQEMKIETTIFDTVEAKLMPSFSFFDMGGNQYPSWTINLPLSNVSRALSDMSITFGGNDWLLLAMVD